MCTALEVRDTSLLLLFDVISGDKWDCSAIGCLHEDFGRQGARVGDLQVLSVLLAEDDIAKVNLWLFHFDKSFLACADERYVDATGLRKDREDRVDVFVQLRGESDGDRR